MSRNTFLYISLQWYFIWNSAQKAWNRDPTWLEITSISFTSQIFLVNDFVCPFSITLTKKKRKYLHGVTNIFFKIKTFQAEKMKNLFFFNLLLENLYLPNFKYIFFSQKYFKVCVYFSFHWFWIKILKIFCIIKMR